MYILMTDCGYVHGYIYMGKYQIAGKFDGKLNLAVGGVGVETGKLICM